MGLVSGIWGAVGALTLFLLVVWVFSGSFETGRKLARKFFVWIGWGFVWVGLGILSIWLLRFVFSWVKGVVVSFSSWSKDRNIDWSSLGGAFVPLVVVTFPRSLGQL